MRKICISILSFFVAAITIAQDGYKVTIDLTVVKRDMVKVIVDLPEITSDYAEYHMARSVPGTYEIADFGRFVVDLEAFDNAGNKLPAEPRGLGGNIYGITNAVGLSRITYWVQDTFDEFRGYNDHFIFEPEGTSFESDRDVFLINTFAMIGYIDGLKSRPYELTIKHPENIYGATSLTRTNFSNDSDVFRAENFNLLADAPILYCEPDTVTREIAGAKIIVSIFSPNKIISAEEVMDNLYDLMVAQSKYMGGELPVDRYAYLIYLMDFPSLSGSMGALEHSYSSIYAFPEDDGEGLNQEIRDFASHEFFHVVTPLNIHSEEIHYFDFIDPKMSQHLWLYEGVTEYSSIHVQVKHDLYDRKNFLNQIREKLLIADEYADDVSFTEMSQRILEEEFIDMFSNVYYKGALIGMCLDLHILKYSNGEKDLQWVIRELSKKYGKDKPFKDDELFDEIETFTFPEIGEFLRMHVGGAEPLPVREVLGWAGVIYKEKFIDKRPTLGGILIGLNEDQDLFVADDSGINDFGKEMGFQTGDIFLTFNDQEFSLYYASDVLEDFFNNYSEGDLVSVEVLREVDGKQVEVLLSGAAQMTEVWQNHGLSFEETPTAEQILIREAWLNAKD